MTLFATQRLLARRLLAADAEAMFTIYGDPETVRFVGDAQPLTLDACRHWIDVTDANFKRRGYGMVALVERASDEIIGCAGVVHPGQQAEPELKYAFRRDRWGKGYATEAVTALLWFARAHWGVGRIVATVDPNNLSSQHVLAKAGFGHATDRTNEDATITQVWQSVG